MQHSSHLVDWMRQRVRPTTTIANNAIVLCLPLSKQESGEAWEDKMREEGENELWGRAGAGQSHSDPEAIWEAIWAA
eukprot:314496-Chlamydomonas_euryale.AAC.2